VSGPRPGEDAMDPTTPGAAGPVTLEVNPCAEAVARTMFQGMPSAISIIDRDFRIRQVNDYLARWLKRSPEEMLGRQCFGLIHKADEPCADCPCATTFRTGEAATTVHTGLDANGDLTYAEIVSLPVRDASGQVTHALEAARDVSERERHLAQLGKLVAELRTSDEQLRRRNEELEILNGLMLRAGGPLRLTDLLDAMLTPALRVAGPAATGGIFLLDEARRELRLAAHRGLDPEFVARERSVRLGECLCGEAALSGEVVISGPGPDPRHTRLPTSSAHDHGHVVIPLTSHEQVLGVLFIHLPAGQAAPPPERERLFRLMGRQIGISIENAQLWQRTDAQLHQKVSELTRALSTVERERARAEQSERAKEEFVSLVSHDLRSPLTVILADSGDYASTCSDPGCAEARASVRQSARRMAVMLNELVDSARLESGTIELHREALFLGDLLRGLAQQSFAASERSRLQLVEPLPAAQLAGDRSWLERALVNVIGNAIKYAPGPTPIRITLALDGDHALVTVTDQGPGIPPDELPLVFQRFYRASNTRRRVDGSGLGLFIARKVVEAHGGEASVQNAEGGGTTIRFRLPLRAV
jgi:PAS domain S-box-containing protein